MKTKAIFSVFGACVVIAFALGACDDNHKHRGGRNGSYDECSTNTTCDTCTAANGCGWCFASDGTGACGSDANACATEWTWEPNYCRAAADASVSTSDDASSTEVLDATSDADAEAPSDADADGE
jgi:hypothetical protein